MSQVGRHTLLAFERENWARLPMTLGLAERTKQAGSAAFKLGKLDQAIALYTEALQSAATLTTDGELKSSLLCNRSLCYLKMGEAEAALSDAVAAQKALPVQPKAHYRAAQALQTLGRNGEARDALAAVLRLSRANKNADAERMLAELEGLPARGPAVSRSAGASGSKDGKDGKASGSGAAAGIAGKANGGVGGMPRAAREDRAQRLTVQEVNLALESRCSKVRAIHKPVDQLRLHHELAHKPDLVVLTNFDWTLLGAGLIRSVNNLKAEELLRPTATVLPAAARVWMMAVQVRTLLLHGVGGI
jgi:tetratricopeptide (TPR) repeat protein